MLFIIININNVIIFANIITVIFSLLIVCFVAISGALIRVKRGLKSLHLKLDVYFFKIDLSLEF